MVVECVRCAAAAYLNIHQSTISKAIKPDEAFRDEMERAVATAHVWPLLRNAQPIASLTERREKKRVRNQDSARAGVIFKRDYEKLMAIQSSLIGPDYGPEVGMGPFEVGQEPLQSGDP